MKVQNMKLYQAADQSGMSERTARKYLKAGKLPSESKIKRDWITRENPFSKDWSQITELLRTNPGLQAKQIFKWLQMETPGSYQDNQLRTLQRQIRRWRAEEGPQKEVYFDQKHTPGKLAECDFTNMSKLGITVNGKLFEHLLFHFVLTWSNWDYAQIAPSESFEALSEGIQEALWRLGGVPAELQTDQLTAAVKQQPVSDFTTRYEALLSHYGIKARKIQVRCPNENGDIESANGKLKTAIDQSLMLRGSRDFDSVTEYEDWLKKLLKQVNAGRSQLVEDELKALRPLPATNIYCWKKVELAVRPSSTINVLGNVYSVNSRLIGETVKARIRSREIDIIYAQKVQETLPRLTGKGKHRINYRHIIDSLRKKPGAFEGYRYKADLFPTVNFRKTYDWFLKYRPATSSKAYLEILYLSANEGERRVDDALKWLLADGDLPPTMEYIQELISDQPSGLLLKMEAATVDLSSYDALLTGLAA